MQPKHLLEAKHRAYFLQCCRKRNKYWNYLDTLELVRRQKLPTGAFKSASTTGTASQISTPDRPPMGVTITAITSNRSISLRALQGIPTRHECCFRARQGKTRAAGRVHSSRLTHFPRNDNRLVECYGLIELSCRLGSRRVYRPRPSDKRKHRLFFVERDTIIRAES